MGAVPPSEEAEGQLTRADHRREHELVRGQRAPWRHQARCRGVRGARPHRRWAAAQRPVFDGRGLCRFALHRCAISATIGRARRHGRLFHRAMVRVRDLSH
eukprot:scaffold5567_cov108-Isochrysis_galbana.AAC.2